MPFLNYQAEVLARLLGSKTRWHRPNEWYYELPTNMPFYGAFATTGSYHPANKSTIGNYSMGTEFGKETEFKTSSIEFKRGKLVDTFEIYYDSRKNLEKLGIIVSNKSSSNFKLKAFSDDGCIPPTNWKV